jgi:hypothetical protein
MGDLRKDSLPVSVLRMDVRRQGRTDDIADLAYYLTDWHDADSITTNTIPLTWPAAAVPPWIIGRMVAPRRA